MARIRSIKPDFFTSERIAELPLSTRLTFIGLWTHVDDNGVTIDNGRLIAAAIWPLEEDPGETLRRTLEDLRRLSEAGLVVRYEANGKRLLFIRSWDEHQKVSHPGKPRYPRPEAVPPKPPTSTNDEFRRISGESPEDFVSPPETLRPEQGAGSREGEQGAGTPHASRAGEPAFIEAEIIGDDEPPPPVLFAVPDPPSTDIAVASTAPSAGHIVRQWIDFCARSNVKLPDRAIKRYGAVIKTALGQGFTEELIKRALAEMLRDRVVDRPGLFENYLVRTQTGPALPPRRATRGEAAAARHSPEGSDIGALIHDALTRPA